MPAKADLARAAAAGVLVALAGCAVLWQLTGGLRIFTSEAWRRADIAAVPRPLPDVILEDHLGRTFHLRDLCGQLLVIDFIYTQCTTVCRSLGASSSQLARRLETSAAAAQASVLSVSFDPRRDTPARMAQFKRSMEASESRWRVVRPRSDPNALLHSFGVVAIADGLGGFEHNAALHVVDRDCRLSKVFDLEDVDDAERWLRARL